MASAEKFHSFSIWSFMLVSPPLWFKNIIRGVETGTMVKLCLPPLTFFGQNLIKKLYIFSKSITVLKTCTPFHSLVHSKNSELWYQKLVSVLILIVDDEVQKKCTTFCEVLGSYIFFQIYSTKFYSRK